MVEFEASGLASRGGEAGSLDRVFQALADPTRRAILQRLVEGERTVSELAAPFAISLAAVSKHLKTLERAGLIARTVQGRERRCRLQAGALASAHEWLAHYQRFWMERFDALDELLSARRDRGEDDG